jgi:hypothetical protein
MTECFESSPINKSRLRPAFPIGRLLGRVVAWFGHGSPEVPRLHADSWSPYMLRDIGLSQSADDQGAADRARSPAEWLIR